MRPSAMIPVAMFLSGMAMIGVAIASGEGEVSLVLIFPVFSGSSGLFVLGTALIVLSFMTGFFMMVRNQVEASQMGDLSDDAGQGWPEDTKYGGVVMIGPIPIIFGSDKRTAFIMFMIGGILAAVCLIALLLLLIQ